MQAADDWMVGGTGEVQGASTTVDAIHAELSRTLDGADPFWTFWLPFYRQRKGSK